MVKLNVNIDHVATLRQARLGKFPSVIRAAKLVEKAKADGITVHLREDRRHIQDKDVFELKEVIKTKLNLEMAVVPDIIKVALKVKPQWVTFVPEKRQELTTEGGLDVIKNKKKLGYIVKLFHKAGILVSFFVNPNVAQIRASKELNADFVEIHTGTYADATDKRKADIEFKKIKKAVLLAFKLKLKVNAGHGLNYNNIKRLTKIKEIEEFSIGHSIVSEAVFVGLEKAVRKMVKLIR